MITSFKIFEKYFLDSKYWIVKIDDLIEYRLYKIGMSENEIKHWMKKIIDDSFKSKHDSIYIGVYMISGLNELDWTYSAYSEKPFVDKKYDFMGDVILTEDDITQYDIKNDVNKYNL